MMLDDVNELFLIDALHLNGELQRFARGRSAGSASAASGAASAADALGELLSTLGLHHYALCSRSLSSWLLDPDGPVDGDSGRAAAATLAARLNDLIEELRHKRPLDEGRDFAVMWMAEYGGSVSVSDTAGPATLPARLFATADLVSDVQTVSGLGSIQAAQQVVPRASVEPAFYQAQMALPTPHLSIEMVADDSDGAVRQAVLSQARRLHARLAHMPPGSEKATLGAEVWQLFQSLHLVSSQIGSVSLASPVSASLPVLGALEVAFEHLAVCRAQPRPVDARQICIDVEVSSSSATGMWTASQAIADCGGRIDASPMGWRLTVPADTDQLHVVVLDTDAGPLALHALQFEAWVAHDDHASVALLAEPSSGSLALRVGALEAEWPLRSRMTSFTEPVQTFDALRFELPSPAHWPCPSGWDALVADESGRIMPLLVPLAVHSGEQYQLTEFA